ncbi:YggT family protein [Prosthecomicrobium sp. N25]|uniref:YggT family protein n=1 Tax=Prosthecomicrobium sp. N25 TaxID=3129254 RepID=UPI003076B676
MRPLVEAVLLVLDLYVWVVILSAIFSWLYAFNVVNTRNQFVSMVGETLYRLTEPVLRPIRRFLPSMGGLDLSPIVLLLLIFIIQRSIQLYVLPRVF